MRSPVSGEPGSLPLVGLTCYREVAAWGVWRQRADLLPVQYADAVVRAGGAPVLLPPATADPGAARAVLAGVDALVLVGGADVAPERYGERPHPQTAGWREDRDAWELALLAAATDAAVPTLGVCRGMQLMAVAAGGALDQHTPDRVGHRRHSPGGAEFGSITVDVVPGSRLHTITGSTLGVHCHHHQSVRTHPGFRPVAWAEDGTLEAMEADDGDRFCLAVQWHPEMARDQRLFDALVEAATGGRRGV